MHVNVVCSSLRKDQKTMGQDEQIVFVIDDDADVRAGLTDLLGSVGLRSEGFRSAAEFLEGQRDGVARCLLLDVRLPGLSGLDLQTRLARDQIDIPIIFITGHGDIPMTVRAIKGGAVEFLTKPFLEQELLEAVQAALARDHARREREEDLRELRKRFETLSPRERQVMTLVTSGLLNKEVAGKIGISEVGVKVHRHKLMKKLSANSLADLVRMADSLGLCSNTP
jgi:RNA polymerase sigma factor (sigma-70 family)